MIYSPPMELGRVIGTVVSSTVYPGLEGVRLLVVQPLTKELTDKGAPLVAADAVQSGRGDVIYYVNSREASLGLDETFVPVDACIVGHVDMVGSRKTAETYGEGR